MAQNGSSLLSLSIAAASAGPVAEPPARSPHGATTTKHRRLSSAGRSRRRLSDARDAATRSFPTSLQTASAYLEALSISSPTVSHRTASGAQPIQVPSVKCAKGTAKGEPVDTDDTHLSVSPARSHPLASNAVNVAKSGRKRGTIFTCESCSKVYRHPSCLIKHRWEHTPQWREASKFVLSKHQQVQLLEAAAILSHLSPTSASLPEDRSLWPSFLSGGLVPPPTSIPNSDVGPAATLPTSALGAQTCLVSSSVPVCSVLGSPEGVNGPRLHDYAIADGGEAVTHVRPGIVGVPAPSPSMPVPLQGIQMSTQTHTTTEDDALNLLALSGTPTSVSHAHTRSSSASHARSHSHSYSHSHSHSHSHSYSLSHVPREQTREAHQRRRSNAYEYAHVDGSLSGGWSLPRSSVRSQSGSSCSRSVSVSLSASAEESRSDDEDEGEEDVGIDVDGDMDGSRVRAWETRVRRGGDEDVNEDGDRDPVGEVKGAGRVGMRTRARARAERTWDGMDMGMDMDMD